MRIIVKNMGDAKRLQDGAREYCHDFKIAIHPLQGNDPRFVIVLMDGPKLGFRRYFETVLPKTTWGKEIEYEIE